MNGWAPHLRRGLSHSSLIWLTRRQRALAGCTRSSTMATASHAHRLDKYPLPSAVLGRVMLTSSAATLWAPTPERQRHLIQECPALPLTLVTEAHMSHDECLLKAADCERNAMTTADPASRTMMFEIAEHWRNLAKTAKAAPEQVDGNHQAPSLARSSNS